MIVLLKFVVHIMLSDWCDECFAEVLNFVIFRFCTPGIMGQTKEQIKYVLGVPSQGYDRPNMDDDDSAMEKMKKDIEASQDNALSLSTEKVLLARQAYDLVSLSSCHFFVVLCSQELMT
jgi:hypothetical protein